MKKVINPKIAVLLPVFKGIKYLVPQVKSIISQKNVNLTLYLSLDPSADGSIEMINFLEKKYKNIFIIKHDKIFKSPTKNFFFLISKINENLYDYISLSDQDDIWFEKKLINSIKTIKQNNCDCYSSNVIAFDRNKNIKQKLFKSGNQKKFDYIFESAGPGSTYVFSKKFISTFKKFLKQKKDAYNFKNYDWLIYAFARNKKFKWIIDEKSSLFYRQHSRNYLGARLSLKSKFFRFKEVVSGRAFQEVSKLLSLLSSEEKKNNILDISNLINLILNSFEFRRNLLDKFLISFYFISIFLFGKFQKNTYRYSVTKLLNIFLLFCIVVLGNKIVLEYFETLTRINYFDQLKIFSVFTLIILIASKRYYNLIYNENYKKINFINWTKIFVNSQIFSIFLPYSSFFYRHYYVNKTISMSYETLFKYTVFIFMSEQLILYVIISCSFAIIADQVVLFIIPMISIILMYFFYSYFEKFFLFFFEVFKKIKYFKNYNLNFVLINSKDQFEIFYLSIAKIFLNFFLFYLVSKSLGYDLGINQILLLIVLNEYLQNFKITPNNIGVAEFSFGLFFGYFLNFDLSSGAIFKIHLRIIEISFYFISGLFFNFYSLERKNS